MKNYNSTYWSGKGKYRKLYDRLWDELVPHEGEASTEAGEIIRIISRIYYDVHNNGGCNFDVLKPERLQLMLLVPKYAQEATKRFIKQPHYTRWLDDVPYQKFMDRYVDWAVKYADALNKAEALKGMLED